MRNSNIETLVLTTLQSYKHIGFTHDTIVERDLFLSVLACSLLLQTSPTNSKVWYVLDELVQSENKADLQFTSDEPNPSIVEFIQDLRKRISAYPSLEKIKNLLKEIRELSTDTLFSTLDKTQAIEFYDRVLQRLQAMNSPNLFSDDFIYQTLPFNLASLVSKLAPVKPKANVYDPYAICGEASVEFALLNKEVKITTESVNQSSIYIYHKLLIAGATSIKTINSFSMSPKANVDSQQFDLAFTLLQPSMSAEIEGSKHKQTKKLAGNFEQERVPKDVLVSRYWEHALIHHMLYSLKPDGKAVVITGLGPLVRQSDFKSRKLLLENNLIDAVVQLPAKLIDYRTVPLYVTIFRKNRLVSEPIKFIDASRYCHFENGINKLVNLDEIAELYHSSNVSKPELVLVSTNSVTQNECSLNVANYVSTLDRHHEYIDFDDTMTALSRQQRITNMLIENLTKILC
ncbi:N-6 DNA methylase [Rheinheimera sp.]|uniref:N-6 DNA methylase n=1 Tax=Rheinheimera sp. TaxID=1869214 RepID=UPI002353EE1F|nr:N-6 DNA methylase [Rheinheimera sp.]